MVDLVNLLLGDTHIHNANFVIDQNERFFVTGGAGSLGRELVFRLLKCDAKTIYVFDNSASRLASLKEFLDDHNDFDPSIVRFVVGDVRSPTDIGEAISESKPHVVFHFAALKHVDLAEMYPDDAFNVNVEGTLNVLKASIQANRFAIMSTDKAVFPRGMMGVTKRFAELLVMSAAETNQNCVYSIIRSGNVIGSSGSALDKFVTQVRDSRAVTITHPKMKRFFIDKGELITLALSAVLEFDAKLGSANTYIIDCGALVNVVDVAERIALALGKKLVNGCPKKNEIGVKYIGIRDGEKLEEEMHHSARLAGTENSKVKIALDDGLNATLQALTSEFQFLCDHSKQYIDDCFERFSQLIQSDQDVPHRNDIVEPN